ncbi:uncharacterized protein MONOS_11106 [Monocercomonoides exilis]|uniref:uncharacterized protein n=1 Tax=Monocercomonoides exilis TaxID=2049356 RepID=UPI0035595F46|nr:hypothetical protein MONOS_11106 [Monocercomonoides exilis]|eukprot:MONOS_11106.1-p1 / transcript=MONOS_11106.1 / gene=MONOS_11106 / organism=Monocercomonoides_exilis_PA203 / gene_product=unspecified product / transcript_product=unspecified product / location=Mono_scaffold00539:4559-6960(-) / protein_length=680 / sequence_SO=supercontig / SO=protein_coding / is_pseudo=false
MSTDASTGILTERQELILKETRLEAKLERGFQRPALPITRVQAPVKEQPGTLQRRFSPQPPQEGINSEEGGTRAVGAGDQGCVNNFRSSSRGNRAEEAHWRENRFVSLSMEANRRREIDKQWSAGHVEKQAVQESSQQSAVQRWSVSSQPTKDRGIQENIRRTVTNRSCYSNGAEGGQTQKQFVPHSKEVRQLETDSRLSETKRSSEENTFQIHGKRLLLQRHAFRLCRCPAPVHTYNEEGDSGDKKKMGCQSRCLFGRSSFSASRSRSLEENNSGNHLVSRKPWPSDKQKEMQPHTEFAVQLPWIRMEYNQLRCVSNEGKKKGSARAVSQVGEKVHKSQDRQSEGFRIIRGKAQCNALRSFRRIFTPPIHLQIVAERSYDRRTGWNDEAVCVNPPTDKKMEMDVDEEPQTQTNSTENRIAQLQLRSDKSSVVFNVKRWNAGRNLLQTLKRIWTLKEKLKIVLKAVHLPGFRNTRADALSRLERAGDYSIADSELKEILSVLQITPTLDAFAAQHNHKVDRWCGIGSPLGEDGLAYPWKNECVLAHPPVHLIPMTIPNAQKERVQVVLLLPNWKGQNWDVLLEKTPHQTFEWRSLRTVLRKGPSITNTGACLSPGRLKVILINPPEGKARAGGEGRWKKDLSQFHWQRSADRELLSRRGMDIYSASRILENSGKRVIWA